MSALNLLILFRSNATISFVTNEVKYLLKLTEKITENLRNISYLCYFASDARGWRIYILIYYPR
jgi:hypothetical protein